MTSTHALIISRAPTDDECKISDICRSVLLLKLKLNNNQIHILVQGPVLFKNFVVVKVKFIGEDTANVNQRLHFN